MSSDFCELIVMTKSSKLGGYCVAGIDINTGSWIRLNSSTNGPLFSADMQYSDGCIAAVLDQVEVAILQEKPLDNQPENLMIDNDFWIKKKKSTLKEVIMIHPIERREYIFGTSKNIVNQDRIESLDHSLELIAVRNITIHQTVNGMGHKKTKMSFEYNHQFHDNYSVTDDRCFNLRDGLTISSAVIVFSLGAQPIGGSYYIFAAHIFPSIREI